VVQIESERFLEALVDEAVLKIQARFSFEAGTSSSIDQALLSKHFKILEPVYSETELEDYFQELVEWCDREVSKRLKAIMPVGVMVEVRNQLEERILHYFDQNTREQNQMQCRKFCHNLLDQIY